MATNGSFAQQDQHKATAEQFPAPTSADKSNLAKDEVSWYFVEQYYTTLSKSPEKLHLFYSKRSQRVCGQEAEIAIVSVGRQTNPKLRLQAIQERLKSLEFQDCKVRVSNVDSQASDDSIVIQVIGETSNKGAEPRKFVQTFVLAKQPSGYFVLNDMLRYIDEEDDAEAEEAKEESAAPASETPETAPEPVAEPAPVEKKLISEVAEKATANGKHTEAEPKAEAPAAPAAEPAAPKETSGWQTAGADSKRQHKPQSTSAGAAEKEGTMGYVKYVTDKVQDADLRAALAAHGELNYFDINRQKNCAFVEYKTLEGYQAAVSSNPHTVNGENIVVEPRRPKAAGHNGNASFGAGRGNGAPRGRGGFEGNRNGGQGNNRGNFGGQNRGRGGAARGRGGAQVANNA
ncbi:hypothetical protein LLEC1_04103 [Akanthomyces lecanii]|uniref:NTF2 domain-containing protein n=1 Tax=Cordyceps confragosa TaxID=2714763 RepID=A0A179IE04_CORDF|nr:hypothetical protein LLEC1_04103 [Akanthomyces lecanii]